jgi:hypothetical protein
MRLQHRQESMALPSLPKAGIVSVAVGLLIVAVVVMIVVIVYNLGKSDVKRYVIIDRPMELSNSSSKPSYKMVAEGKLPSNVVGREFSYSFWLFLRDVDSTDSTKQKLVWYRAPNLRAYGAAHPIVVMDPVTNRLTCYIGTSKTDNANIQLPTKGNTRNFVDLTIDYVPLQRWVMVTLVVKDRLASVYLDDTVYASKPIGNSNDRALARSPNSGSVFIGRDTSDAMTINGYIARFCYYNFALNQRLIQAIFSAGPSASSLLASLGLPAYGVRTPLYRLDTETNE